MIKLHEVEQVSDEWFALRTKYPLTASHAQAIATAGKGLETLCYDKLSERHSSAKKEQITNEDIERGIELESQAYDVYELQTGGKVTTVGFVTDEDISKVAGASPDGLVGEDGLLEIKCPKDEKYFRLLINPVVESKHNWQMQQQMLFTNRKWCDYVLYNPNFTKSLIIIRVERNEDDIKKLIVGLKKGEEIIKEIEAKLK